MSLERLFGLYTVNERMPDTNVTDNVDKQRSNDDLSH